MGSSMLLDLVFHSPRLVVLNLPKTRLCLSLTDLKKICPLLKLESMELFMLWFESPQRLLEPDMFKQLSVAWRKLFPSLSTVPCPGDQYSEYWEKDINTTRDDDDVGNAEMTYKEPAFGFDDCNSPCFVLRVMPRNTLGYKRKSWYHDKLRNMWQANMERETIVWPVVPFQFSRTSLLLDVYSRSILALLAEAGCIHEPCLRLSR